MTYAAVIIVGFYDAGTYLKMVFQTALSYTVSKINITRKHAISSTPWNSKKKRIDIISAIGPVNQAFFCVFVHLGDVFS